MTSTLKKPAARAFAATNTTNVYSIQQAHQSWLDKQDRGQYFKIDFFELAAPCAPPKTHPVGVDFLAGRSQAYASSRAMRNSFTSGIAGALGNLLAVKKNLPASGPGPDVESASAGAEGASVGTKAKAAPVMLHETEHNVSTVSYLLQVRPYLHRALCSPIPLADPYLVPF